MNVLDYATRVEEEGLRLFERLEHETENRELKEIFGLLAATKREHCASLATMKQQINPADAESVMAERAREVKSGFQTLYESSDTMHELRKDQDGFWHIVKAEEEAIRLYEGMAAAETQPNARLLLQKIADDEKKHLEVIENIYDFVESPHTYLEWGEFSNLHRL